MFKMNNFYFILNSNVKYFSENKNVNVVHWLLIYRITLDYK